MIPRILAIAGSDSGGGAGIQADIKTITMLGGHAMTAITAITAQNTLEVAEVMPVPAAMVLAQIDAVVRDIGVDAIKIGMIGSAEVAEAVAERLRRPDLADVPVVFDPVMVASSGAVLADARTIDAFERLLARATLVTPNAPELALLTGRDVEDADALVAAARALAERIDGAVLAKGGHLPGDDVTEVFTIGRFGSYALWSQPRIKTRHSHGTGCTLASACATLLGRQVDIGDAVHQAGDYVRAALLAAPGFGQGHGPMGHGLGRVHFP